MTNDYLFKALMQKNPRLLKGLICSLLHLSSKDVKNVRIKNPIILGESVDDKTVVLDVNVGFNNGECINLEMQVVNEYNWPERSTYYACRNFSTLNAGKKYEHIKPVHQIGLVDFTPLPKYSKFYSIYQLSEIHDHNIYTDKLTISTLDLTNIRLATDEDKAYNIDVWAKLFKSQTWEDIKMLAEEYSFVDDAATTIYEISEDERIRQQCQAREDYELRQRSIMDRIKERDKMLKQKDKLLEQKNNTIEQLTKEIAELKAQLEAKK